MRAFQHLRRAILPCILALLPLQALSDPPQLTGPNGPAVQFGVTPQASDLLASERGLAITVGDLADLAPAYDAGAGSVPIVLNDGTAGTVTSPQIPVRYGPDGGRYALPDTLGQPGSAFTNSFGYRLTRTAETVDLAVDGGVVIRARIGALGGIIASAAAPTFAAAQALLLANPALDGIRDAIAAMQAVLATPTVTTTEATTSLLTGRDTYRTRLITFGPDSDFIRAGNLGACNASLTGCEGGTAVEIPDGNTHLNEVTLQDLYITDTLTRTATTVQNWFLNLTLDEGTDPPRLTGPNGPQVRVGIGTQDSTLFTSERGLAIPVGDLADLVPAFNDGTGERIMEGASYAPDDGTEVLVGTDDGTGTTIFTRESFGYRLFRADRTVDVAVDGGVTVQARIGSAGAVLATAAGATVEAVRALLLADTALDGIRHLILSADLVATAPTVTTTEATTTLLTGRDTYFTQVVTFGPDTAMAGNLGECAAPVTDCEGGTTIEVPVNGLFLNPTILQDLYITDTLTRTATTVQNWFLNLTLADPLDPPQLTEGPLVQLGGGPVQSSLVVSERGLAIPVDDLADLAPVYRIGAVETQITLNDGSGGAGTPGPAFPARYAPDGGSYELDENTGSDETPVANAFGYRVFRADRTVDEAVDGGVTVRARIGSAGAVLATAAGTTVEAVRALLLADTALDSIRSLIVAAELVQVASTVTMAEATTSLLTGRDTYQVTGITFGPTGGIMVGNLGECATPLTGCEGGTEVTIGTGATHFNTVTLQDLYITDTLTRTATTVQNWFLNLTLADPVDPPQLTDGPLVQVGSRSFESELFASERGLAIPVGNLADLAPVYNDGTGDIAILTTFDEVRSPARYAPDSGFIQMEPVDGGGGTVINTFNAFGYRLFRNDRTVDVAVDGGDGVSARIGTTGPVLARATGPTLEAARDAVLADAALDGIRADILRVEAVAAAPTVTVEEVETSLLTGRDTYGTTVVTFGPEVILAGNLGQCVTAVTDCAGGVEVGLANGVTNFTNLFVQDLYITDTLTRTVTTVQNWFLNIFLTGADGTPHVAAQGVGLAGGEGFLARMLAERRPAAPQVTSGIAATGPLAFAAISGAQGTFDSIGGAGPSDWNSRQFTGGFTWAVSPDWTLGVAVETGNWNWDGGGATATGDSRKFGLFGTYARGPLTFGISGFVGQQGVRTTDTFGAASDYDVATRGLAVQVGYALQQGEWVITPMAGLRLLQWDAPAVTDSLGNVTEAAFVQQLRPELGVTLARSFALPQGELDLSLDARIWAVTGDRTAVISAGILTQGKDTGSIGGRIGVAADWTLAQGSILTARVEHVFDEGDDGTSVSLGLRMKF